MQLFFKVTTLSENNARCLLASGAANYIFSSAQNANAKGENLSVIFLYTDFRVCNEITRTLHVIKSDCWTRSARSL